MAQKQFLAFWHVLAVKDLRNYSCVGFFGIKVVKLIPINTRGACDSDINRWLPMSDLFRPQERSID